MPETEAALADQITVQPAPDDRAAKVDRAIAAWMVSHIHNSPVTRATDAFNHLSASLAALRDAIVRDL